MFQIKKKLITIKDSLSLEYVDVRRRRFIKLAAFGGLAFLAGKYIGPFVNMIQGDTVINEKVFENFTFTETGKQMKVTDNEGGELLIIDKESF